MSAMSSTSEAISKGTTQLVKSSPPNCSRLGPRSSCVSRRLLRMTVPRAARTPTAATAATAHCGLGRTLEKSSARVSIIAKSSTMVTAPP